MPDRKSEAVWSGDLKSGHGTIKLGSGAIQADYSFSSRFEDGQGTNPEELIAAAHASCFTMALAFALAVPALPMARWRRTPRSRSTARATSKSSWSPAS